MEEAGADGTAAVVDPERAHGLERVVVAVPHVHVLLAQELGGPPATNAIPLGWGGDRFRLAGEAGRESIVWVVVFDGAFQRNRFEAGVGARLLARERAGYRGRLDTLTVGGRAGLRFVAAPEEWDGWSRLPTAEVRP